MKEDKLNKKQYLSKVGKVVTAPIGPVNRLLTSKDTKAILKRNMMSLIKGKIKYSRLKT